MRIDSMAGDIPADAPRCAHGTRLDRWCPPCDEGWEAGNAPAIAAAEWERAIAERPDSQSGAWLGVLLLLLAALAGFALGRLA